MNPGDSRMVELSLRAQQKEYLRGGAEEEVTNEAEGAEAEGSKVDVGREEWDEEEIMNS